MIKYNDMLLKSPIPLIIIRIESNNYIIRYTNEVFDKFINKNNINIKDNDIVKSLAKETIKGRDSVSYIEGINKIYKLISQKIEENEVIIWFTQVLDLKDDIHNMNNTLGVVSRNMQDVFFLLENDKVIYASESYKNIFNSKCRYNYDLKNILYNFIYEEDRYIIDDYNYKREFDKKFRVYIGQDIKWIWMRSKPILDENIKECIAIVTLSDITKKIERDTIIKESRSNFISNLTHEFKTPLNLIFSSIQLINKKININNICDEEYLKKYLGIITQNSYRILKLVNNMLDDTKLDLGYLVYTPTNSDIISFVESICQSVAYFVNENNMNIIFDTDIEELVISFDMEKMEKIILNLISNSVKFRTRINGQIMVNISHDEDYINISVKDNGIGIPKGRIDTIFDKYSRINDDRSIVKEGSGIGLSLVWDFVKMHSGSIKVDSMLGHWTEFNIKIPNKVIEENSYVPCEYSKDRVEKIKIEFSDIYK